MLTWQKELVDFYGYDNLVKWQAGVGDEFSPENAFETGKLAMNYDGEWRTAFIKNEAPDLDYGTARPAPTSEPDAVRRRARSTARSSACPRAPNNPDEAWALLKYLTTDDAALVELANGLGNVPSTTSSSQSPDLDLPEQFATFIDIFNNASTPTRRRSPPSATATSSSCSRSSRSGRPARWTTSPAGLADVDDQIDAQLEQATGGGAP